MKNYISLMILLKSFHFDQLLRIDIPTSPFLSVISFSILRDTPQPPYQVSAVSESWLRPPTPLNKLM